jgi:hypothetical protein
MKKVRKAEKTARENAKKYPNMFTVLFFDEANTTEAIGVIKEIMCDKSLENSEHVWIFFGIFPSCFFCLPDLFHNIISSSTSMDLKYNAYIRYY